MFVAVSHWSGLKSLDSATLSILDSLWDSSQISWCCLCHGDPADPAPSHAPAVHGLAVGLGQLKALGLSWPWPSPVTALGRAGGWWRCWWASSEGLRARELAQRLAGCSTWSRPDFLFSTSWFYSRVRGEAFSVTRLLSHPWLKYLIDLLPWLVAAINNHGAASLFH